MPREVLKPTCYAEHEVMCLPESYRSAELSKVAVGVLDPISRLVDNAKFYAQQGYVLLLSGPDRCGKSSAAAVIAMLTMETGLRALWQNQWSIGDAVRWDQAYSASETILHRILNVSLLVIDDLQKFTDADRFWTERELRVLLRRRAENRKSTILTTTLSPQQWSWMRAGVSNFLDLGITRSQYGAALTSDLFGVAAPVITPPLPATPLIRRAPPKTKRPVKADVPLPEGTTTDYDLPLDWG